MDIHDLMKEPDNIYFEPDFIRNIEDHLSYLKKGNLNKVTITPHQSYKYEGDFYGLLDELNINKQYHLLVARVNGYDSSADFNGENTTVIVPDLGTIDLMKNIYKQKIL